MVLTCYSPFTVSFICKHISAAVDTWVNIMVQRINLIIMFAKYLIKFEFIHKIPQCMEFLKKIELCISLNFLANFIILPISFSNSIFWEHITPGYECLATLAVAKHSFPMLKFDLFNLVNDTLILFRVGSA